LLSSKLLDCGDGGPALQLYRYVTRRFSSSYWIVPSLFLSPEKWFEMGSLTAGDRPLFKLNFARIP
jgi:hypothetical protein